MIRRSFGLAACAAFGIVTGSMLATQEPAKAQTCVSGRLADWNLQATARPWHEIEGAWTGEWVVARAAVPGGMSTHRASFTKGSETATSLMQVSTIGNHVTVQRFDPHGTCQYDGNFSNNVAWVDGTYHCSWNRAGVLLPFKAMLGQGLLPRNVCSGTPDRRLTAIWHTREGDWSGVWNMVNAPGAGQYEAHWSKGTETATARLQMTLDGDELSITRVQPRGLCFYTGRFDPDGVHVSGTSRCDWDLGRDGFPAARPFSAVVG